jgi:hypothetical protein
VTLPVWTINPYTPLALTDIKFEFVGNSQPLDEINLSDYYSDSYTGYVSSGRVGYPNGIETPIPTIGNAISISNFYGASAVSYSIYTDKQSYNEGEVVIFTISAPLADNSIIFWEIVDVTVEIIITPEILPNGRRNIPYTPVTLAAAGGVAPYAWSVSYGALPPGMTMAANGRISGTPTSIGSSLFAATVLDSNNNSNFKVYSLNVETIQIQITPTVLQNAVRNVPYTASIVALEGQPPYTYSIFSGFLPIGMTLSTAGVISGTANIVGTSNFTIRAQDANTNFATKQYVLQVQDVAIQLGPTSLLNAKINAYYQVDLSATNGTSPYSYIIQTGALPPGLSLDFQTGRISGRATQIGTFSFTARATDFYFNFATRDYTIVIENVALTLIPSQLSNGTQNINYSSITFAAEGGTAPYTYAVTQGSLPTGMTLSAGGLLSGKPTVAGSTTFKITVTDADNNTKSVNYSINIIPVLLSVSPTALNDAFVNVPYSVTFTASGGSAPYTFVLSSVANAAGLTFSNGVLSGTPTQAGTWIFNIDATDSNGNTGGRQFSLVILPNAIVPMSVPIGLQSADYVLQFSVDNNYGEYSYSSLTELPDGLSLSSDGLLSGIPTQSGQFQVVLNAENNIDGSIPLVNDFPLVVLPSQWTFVEKTHGIAPTTIKDGDALSFDIVAPSNIPPDAIIKLVAKVNDTIVASSMTPLIDRSGTGYLTVTKSLLPQNTSSFMVHIVNGLGYVIATYGQVTISDA